MNIITPFFIAFIFIFLSELGDKTQLLVLSFSTKLKTYTILLGIAIGAFFSHGIAILFGSFLGNINNTFLEHILQIITFLSFIILGIYILLKKSDDINNNTSITKHLKNFSNLKLHYVIIIATSIAIGELGDKTFLASIGLGINYPDYKISLILGAITGMIISDCIAIFLGKLLSSKFNTNYVNKLSGLLFLVFGVIGIIFL